MSMVKANSSGGLSPAIERTGNWVSCQEIPTDMEVTVGEAVFSLHKFMVVSKSNYIRKLIMESKEPDLARIDMSDMPGGAQCFEKAAKFCYGVNFEITVQNVAALRCAAEYLQMTDKYCDNNLAGRTEDFLNEVALANLSGAIVVLNSCQSLPSLADDLGLVQKCIEVVSSRACKEARFPTRVPPNWWAEELSNLGIESFAQVVAYMNKSREARSISVITALTTYVKRSLLSDQGFKRGDNKRQLQILETVVALLPLDKSAFSVNFLCSLLRSAIFLQASSACKTELQKRISAILEQVAVDDLLMLSFSSDKGETVLDLDEIEREKVCSLMDAFKLSYQARLHASQNKRLPVQIVFHVLYYDQLKLTSGANDFDESKDTAKTKCQMGSDDVSLIRESKTLRAELMKMKMYVSDLQKNNPGTSKQQGGPKKPKFFSSMSKTLGKLNPFRLGSKDTFYREDDHDTTKPRRRRFSISQFVFPWIVVCSEFVIHLSICLLVPQFSLTVIVCNSEIDFNGVYDSSK